MFAKLPASNETHSIACKPQLWSVCPSHASDAGALRTSECVNAVNKPIVSLQEAASAVMHTGVV